MPMTKRDYEGVGQVLAGIPKSGGIRLQSVVAACNVFSARNPKFDRVKFAESSGCYACDVEGCFRIYDNDSSLENHQIENH